MRLETHVLPAAQSGVAMRKTPRKVNEELEPDRDTMRDEYDFSRGVRGVTAARFREGVKVVVLRGKPKPAKRRRRRSQ